MRIGPITDAMAAERIRTSRQNFEDAANYVRDHAPPGDIDPVLWAMHGASCREMCAEMDEALAKWEKRNREMTR